MAKKRRRHSDEFKAKVAFVSGHLKPATKERFKTGHFEGEVSTVECLLTKGGSIDGEPDQSGYKELDINTP